MNGWNVRNAGFWWTMETAVMIQFVPGAERKWVMNNAEADNRHPKKDRKPVSENLLGSGRERFCS